ncbi:MAG: glycosyltransferase [Nitrospirae bacterium]|nr:MAG: glycosyltransferase [Nitrospirota bacterium]
MPRISVIIPAYNGETRYLREAIQSVLAQTIQDFELIVVDDASEDDPCRILPKHSFIQYYRRTSNGGQAVARNDGARLASGQFLAFLDQDDLWEPAFLEATLEVFHKAPETALVHTDGYQVNERNHILEYDAAMKHTKSICQLLRNGHDTATSGSLIRKHCFDAIGGYDEHLTIWEDIDLGIRLSQRFLIHHLPEPLYRHRLYTRNVSRGIPPERALRAREYFLNKYSSHCLSDPIYKKALARDWAQYYSDKGKFHLARGEKQQARKAFIASLQSSPYSQRTLLRLLKTYFPRFSRFQLV